MPLFDPVMSFVISKIFLFILCSWICSAESDIDIWTYIPKEPICGNPAIPANGYIQAETFDLEHSLNTTLTFGCNEGYALYGHRKITCLKDGTWSHPSPECLDVNMCTSDRASVPIDPSTCITIKKESVTWNEANDACRQHGGTLSERTEDFALLQQNTDIKIDSEYWIGGVLKKKWFWSKGEQLAYFNWGKNEPSDTDIEETNILLHQGIHNDYKWKDDSSDSLAKFICQFDVNVPCDETPRSIPIVQDGVNSCLFFGGPYGTNFTDSVAVNYLYQGSTWLQANATCAQQRGFLVRISDAEIHEAIVAKIKSDEELFGDYWIGGYWNKSEPGYWAGAKGDDQLEPSEICGVESEIDDDIKERCLYADIAYDCFVKDYCNFKRGYLCETNAKQVPKPIQCSTPPFPLHAFIINSHNVHIGGMVEFRCMPGFVLLKGDRTRTCKNDGTWSGQEILCVNGSIGVIPTNNVTHDPRRVTSVPASATTSALLKHTTTESPNTTIMNHLNTLGTQNEDGDDKFPGWLVGLIIGCIVFLVTIILSFIVLGIILLKRKQVKQCEVLYKTAEKTFNETNINIGMEEIDMTAESRGDLRAKNKRSPSVAIRSESESGDARYDGVPERQISMVSNDLYNYNKQEVQRQFSQPNVKRPRVFSKQRSTSKVDSASSMESGLPIVKGSCSNSVSDLQLAVAGFVNPLMVTETERKDDSVDIADVTLEMIPDEDVVNDDENKSEEDEVDYATVDGELDSRPVSAISSSVGYDRVGSPLSVSSYASVFLPDGTPRSSRLSEATSSIGYESIDSYTKCERIQSSLSADEQSLSIEIPQSSNSISTLENSYENVNFKAHPLPTSNRKSSSPPSSNRCSSESSGYLRMNRHITCPTLNDSRSFSPLSDDVFEEWVEPDDTNTRLSQGRLSLQINDSVV